MSTFLNFMQEPLFVNILTSVLITIATCFSAFAAYQSRKAISNQSKITDDNWYWDAFNLYDKQSITDEYLDIHGLNDDILKNHQLNREKLRNYLLLTNLAWRSRFSSERYNEFNSKKFKTFEEGVQYILKNNINWPEGYRLRIIFESKQFALAWPILKRWWVESPTAKTTQILEAAVRRGKKTVQ